MLLSLVLHTYSMRYVLPAAVMMGTAPTYMLAWGAWRLLSAVLPARFYREVDDRLYTIYQSMVLFFFENYTGVQVSRLGRTGQGRAGGSGGPGGGRRWCRLWARPLGPPTDRCGRGLCRDRRGSASFRSRRCSSGDAFHRVLVLCSFCRSGKQKRCDTGRALSALEWQPPLHTLNPCGLCCTSVVLNWQQMRKLASAIIVHNTRTSF